MVKVFILLNFFVLSWYYSSAQAVLLPIEVHGKWGLLNTNAEIITQPQYDFLHIDKTSKLAFVQKNEKFGIVDSTGYEIINTQYDSIVSYSPYILALYKNTEVLVYNLQTKKQTEFFPISNFRMINNLLLFAKNSKCTFLHNIKTLQSVELDIDDIAEVMYTNKKDDMLSFFVQEKYYIIFSKNEKYGLLDSTFKEILPAKFSNISLKWNCFLVESFSNEQNKYRKFEGLYKTTGEELIPCIYNRIFPEGNFWRVSKNNSVGLYDISAKKEIVESIFDFLQILPSGNFLVGTQQGGCGVIGKNGKYILDANYLRIEECGKFYKIKSNKKWGVANESGRVVVAEIHDFVDIYNNSVIVFEEKGMYGLKNLAGNIILKPTLEYIHSMKDNYIEVGIKRKLGVIDNQGKTIVNPEFYALEYNDAAKVFLVCTGTIHPKLPYTYRFADKLKATDVKWGVVNRQKEWLLDTIFEKRQINCFPESFMVQAKTDSGVYVTNYDEHGFKIEQNFYANYNTIKVYNILTTSKPYYWRNDDKNTRLWGLWAYTGQEILEYQYRNILANFHNNPDLVQTSNKTSSGYCLIPPASTDIKFADYSTYKTSERIGVVNDLIGKVLVPTTMIYIDPPSKNNVLRMLSTKGIFYVVNQKFERIGSSYNYVDEYVDGYTRYNKGGTLSCNKYGTYSLRTPEYVTNQQKKCMECVQGSLQCNGGKWGILDSLGNVVVKAEYDFIQHHFNKMFIAKKAGKWGVINANNTVIIPFKYNEIQYIKEDFAPYHWIACDLLKAKYNNKWGVIDTSRAIKLNHEYFDVKVLMLKEGIFYAVKDSGGWGLISSEKQQIIPCKWDSIELFQTKNTNLIKTTTKDTVRTYIDENGKKITSLLFRTAADFKDSFARVSINGKTYNYINKEGKLISDIDFEQSTMFTEKKAAIQKKGLWGYIDTTGKILIEPQYTWVGEFHNGLAPVTKWKKAKLFGIIPKKIIRGYISEDNIMRIRTKYDSCWNFSYGMAKVQKDKDFGVISSNGKFIFPIKYRDVIIDSCLAIVRSEGEMIVKTNENKRIGAENKISQCKALSEGILPLKIAGKWGFMDINGKLIYPAVYSDVKPFSQGIAAFNEKNKWGFLTKNKILQEAKYKDVTSFKNGLSTVVLNNRTFLLDRNLNTSEMNSMQILSSEYINGKIPYLFSNKRYAFLDSSGNKKFNQLFNYAEPYNGNVAIVKKNKYGIINTNGAWVVRPNVSKISTFRENRAILSFSNSYCLFSLNGKVITGSDVLRIENKGSGIYEIEEVNYNYYINSLGNIIWKIEN